jgi:hypothetical protein
MTADTTTTARRANQEGHLCPSWCTEDHATWSVHAGDIAGETRYGRVRLKALTVAGADQTHVVLSTWNGSVWALPGTEAEQLARLLEDLAALPARELRDLACYVRDADATARGEL